MKEAIEVAIKNRFDLKQFSPKCDKIKGWSYGGKTLALHPLKDGRYMTSVYVGVHELVFGTDFIEKLVGDGLYCETKMKHHPNRAFDCGICNPSNSMVPPCILSGWKIEKADHHLRQLANLKAIDKIKEYINNLIGD